MHLLFFNLEGGIENVMVKVKDFLGLKNLFYEGDSSNVKDGIYYSYLIFGVKIKLEYNSYDYDDKYEYMVSIRKDDVSEVDAEEYFINDIANIVITLLGKNLKSRIGYEDSGSNFKFYERGSKKIFI
jgi:hypothetical protein